MSKETLIARAVRLAGGASTVARELNIVKPWAVYKWVEQNRVPPYRVIPLEKLSGISRHRLDARLYPRDRKYYR